jgi:hypothetical protein
LLVSDVRCRTNALLPVRHQTPGFGYFGTLRVRAIDLRWRFNAFAFLLRWGRWDMSHFVHCSPEGATLAMVQSVRSESTSDKIYTHLVLELGFSRTFYFESMLE